MQRQTDRRTDRLRLTALLAVALAVALTLLAAGGAQIAGAQVIVPPEPPEVLPPAVPLNTVPVPLSPSERDFVADRGAAIKLGKALFWDMQAGSDGRTACASCHYAAGADNRSQNQVSPIGPSFDLKGPNGRLTAADFPFHKIADPTDRDSAVLSDTDDVSGSQGVVPSIFNSITLGSASEDQTYAPTDPDFHVGGVNIRRTTGRNTPSAINAVFFHRNFWDGRAQFEFNGVNPFGTRDPNARVGKLNGAGGIDQVAVRVQQSSLASQSTGPPGSGIEMSAQGRSMSEMGRKLLSLRPLGTQQISRNDSVLGPDVTESGRGLNTVYAELIKQAFRPEWWNSTEDVPGGAGYDLIEYNFALFWGLAIQAYERTLVSDAAPIDRFLAGDRAAISESAARGFNNFQSGKTSCSLCHSGPLFSEATIDTVLAFPVSLDAGRFHDTGFYNVGVRPTGEDAGTGGFDPMGNSLSNSRRAGRTPDMVQGSFKMPGLRNVALTAPYFHNGGTLTLRGVVEFYDRGGDFANNEIPTDGRIKPLGLSEQEIDELVAFMESLTDPRVANRSAPFDHPQLFVPVGAQTSPDGSLLTDGTGRAVDCFKEISTTGAEGGAPLAKFPDFVADTCDTPPELPVGAPPGSGGGGGDTGGSTPSAVNPGAAIACVVPNLRNLTVTRARAALVRASCGLGRVTRTRGVRGQQVVIAQGQRVGTRLGQGALVTVRVRVGGACVVPRLRGRSLASARAALTRANCRLGRVTGVPVSARRNSIVVSQRPSAGLRRGAGATITVRVRRAARR